MEPVMELLYRASRPDESLQAHSPESAYAGKYEARRKIIRELLDGMTMEQKLKFDEYGLADDEAREILNYESFRRAFHLGAQLMAELLQDGDAAFPGNEFSEEEVLS